MTQTILVLNAGSSSIKFQLFAVAANNQLARRIKGQMEGIGSRPRLLAKGADGNSLVDESWSSAEVGGVPAGLDRVLAFLRAQIGGRMPSAIGHRGVHGGAHYDGPTIVKA